MIYVDGIVTSNSKIGNLGYMRKKNKHKTECEKLIGI